MFGLFETMLKLYKDLPKTKKPHEQESIERQIAATDNQIDAPVYELYGLTEEEIRIVEGGAPSSGTSPLRTDRDSAYHDETGGMRDDACCQQKAGRLIVTPGFHESRDS
jgi:hypothetical protein